MPALHYYSRTSYLVPRISFLYFRTLDNVLKSNEMKSYTIPALTVVLMVLAGCGTSRMTEQQRFERSILKDIPFSVDSVSWLFTPLSFGEGLGVRSGDFPTFRFANAEYTDARPDAEIRPNGDYWVCNTFDAEQPKPQSEENIWRNVLVSHSNQRVVCIDRYLRGGRTVGYCYVFQSERKEYPTYGTLHWDVSDARNIEMVGEMLNDLKGLALKRHQMNNAELSCPASQDDYWKLIFHADSLFDGRLYDEARQVYDLAFSDDRYILPSQLSRVADKMATIGNHQAALAYLCHRIAMEKDFYEAPSVTSHIELKDTFEVRSRQWNYDLALKEKLENIFERDQYDRLLWSQAVKNNPGDAERNEQLAQRALTTDSLNLVLVDEILSQHGFPRKEQVGDFANQAAWLVFQHADLKYQKRFLPQLEAAVSAREKPAAVFLALLRDRIDVREGRPQRYGTQIDGKGNIAPLLDASRVNQWRQEVGLPPIEQYENRNK